MQCLLACVAGDNESALLLSDVCGAGLGSGIATASLPRQCSVSVSVGPGFCTSCVVARVRYTHTHTDAHAHAHTDTDTHTHTHTHTHGDPRPLGRVPASACIRSAFLLSMGACIIPSCIERRHTWDAYAIHSSRVIIAVTLTSASWSALPGARPVFVAVTAALWSLSASCTGSVGASLQRVAHTHRGQA